MLTTAAGGPDASFVPEPTALCLAGCDRRSQWKWLRATVATWRSPFVGVTPNGVLVARGTAAS